MGHSSPAAGRPTDGPDTGTSAEGWAPAAWKAAVMLAGTVGGFILVPNWLVNYLSLHVVPRTRDALVTLWVVVVFIGLSWVFVALQRRRTT